MNKFEIIHPLNNLNDTIKSAKINYINKSEEENPDFSSVYLTIYDALIKIKEFRAQQQKYMFTWNDIYHISKQTNLLKNHLNDIVEVKNFYNNILEILNSFVKQLILIQFDESNTSSALPTISQLEKILTIPSSDGDPLLSFFEEYDYTKDKEINRKIIIVGDKNMFKVWENITEGKYDENFVKYLNRYLGLLKNYAKNENKQQINERSASSIYTPRNGFTNEELMEIIATYKKL